MNINMNINEIIKRAHQNAVKKGFYNFEKSTEEHTLEKGMLIITEIGELINADRKQKFVTCPVYEIMRHFQNPGFSKFGDLFEILIKDRFEDELADIFIRCADLCGHLNVTFPGDILEKILNEKKISFLKQIYFINKHVLNIIQGKRVEKEYIQELSPFFLYNFQEIFDLLFMLATDRGIDLSKFIEWKMRYNEGREYMHGKKY